MFQWALALIPPVLAYSWSVRPDRKQGAYGLAGFALQGLALGFVWAGFAATGGPVKRGHPATERNQLGRI